MSARRSAFEARNVALAGATCHGCCRIGARRGGLTERAGGGHGSRVEKGPEPGRVLIVDDDAFTRTFLTDVLQQDGHLVESVATGQEGLEAAGRADVVLLDVVLPDLPGLDVLDRLHQQDVSKEVVIITALKDADTAVGALRGRAFDYLVKPLLPAVVQRTVQRALETRRLVGENRDLRKALDQVRAGQRVLSSPRIEDVATGLLEGLMALTESVYGASWLDGEVAANAGWGREEAQARLAALGPPPADVEVEATVGGAGVFMRVDTGDVRVRAVVARNANAEAYGAPEVDAARFMARNASTALDHHARYTAARDAARRDGLTGLLNATVLEEGLNQAVSRVGGQGGYCAVIFMDLDAFKGINDTHGHLAGSRTLQEVGGLLARAVRGEDLVCRFGGDEFVVVLPDTTPEHARSVAERLRTIAYHHRFLVREGPGVKVTLSLGLAIHPGDGADARALLAKADAAMYEAKRRGKNQLVCAADM